MGLDMYLEGKKYLPRDFENPSTDLLIDGYRLKEQVLELGYWRKHPNLHGFIVQNFADGEDRCQDIELLETDIELIIKCTKDKTLPETSGFFFGKSDGSEDEETIEIFTKALEWVKARDNGSRFRSIVYRASW